MMDINNLKYGDTVKLISGTIPMKIEKFIWNDFDSVNKSYCDEIECSWIEDSVTKRDVFDYKHLTYF